MILCMEGETLQELSDFFFLLCHRPLRGVDPFPCAYTLSPYNPHKHPEYRWVEGQLASMK